MRFRIEQLLCPFGVVGEKQQALAGFIEPAYRRYEWQVRTEYAEDSVSSLFIASCCYQATRLVQHQVDAFSGLKSTVIELDTIFSEVNRPLRIAPHDAVEP